jgi:hypothetical protein
MPFAPPRAHWENGIAASLIALGLTLTSASLATEASGTTEVAACLELVPRPMEGGIEYHLTNHCEKSLTCTVNWTLSCGEKPPLHHLYRTVTTIIEPSLERVVTASARECKGESWDVSQVSWACSGK